MITLSRIKKAKSSLTESESSIKDIAKAVGFTDITTFINTFKNLAGVTPEAWRKNRLEDAREEDEELEENGSN
jgi:AraC-like DNA-binding protein